jgi:hypothetical protein
MTVAQFWFFVRDTFYETRHHSRLCTSLCPGLGIPVIVSWARESSPRSLRALDWKMKCEPEIQSTQVNMWANTEASFMEMSHCGLYTVLPALEIFLSGEYLVLLIL